LSRTCADPAEISRGVALSTPELVAKRLEILREALPQATRFLVFTDAYSAEQFEAMRQTAERLRVQLVAHAFETHPHAFEPAFEQGEKAGVAALLLPTSPVFFDRRATIYEIAVKRKLPLAVGGSAWWTGTGWLLGLGVIAEKTYARAGDIAANILNGRARARSRWSNRATLSWRST
jgi:putative tryptophan/tyrosine transport system substrate-binding protein